MTRAIRFARVLALAVAACMLAPQLAWAQASPTPVVQTTYVPANAQAAGVVYLGRLLTASELEWFPIEIAVAAAQKEAGIDLMTLEQITLSTRIEEKGQPLQGGAVLRFSKPFDKAQAAAALAKAVSEGSEVTKAQHGQIEYLKAEAEGYVVAVAAPTDRVLLLAEETWLKAMLDHAQPPAGKPSRIVQLLSQADTKADFSGVFDFTAVSSKVVAELDKEKIPAEFEKFKKIPSLMGAVFASMSLRMGLRDKLVIQAKDEAAAKELDVLIPEGIETGRKYLLAEVAKQPANTAIEKATQKYLERVSGELAAAFRPVRRGTELSLEKDSGGGMMEIAFLNALLLPAVEKVRAVQQRVEE